MKKIFLILSTILATVMAVSCQDTDETDLVATTGVTLSATEVSIFPGEQVELKATLTPDNCTSSYKTWASSDAKVATVDIGYLRLNHIRHEGKKHYCQDPVSFHIYKDSVCYNLLSLFFLQK